MVGGGYSDFIVAVKSFGGESIITQTLRLERFKGSYEDITDSSFEKTAYGIKTLLTADSDTRESYYLSKDAFSEINKNESFFDMTNNIAFVKTDIRFDDYEKFDLLLKQNHGEKDLVVFTHEWLLFFNMRKNVLAYARQCYTNFKIRKNMERFFKKCLSDGYQFTNEI